MANVHEINTDTPSMDYLLSLLDGVKTTMTVMAACELELFDELASCDVTVAKLSARAGWDADALERLLNACVALKLTKKEQNNMEEYVYSNTSSGAFLAKGASTSIWGMSELLGRTIKNMSSMADEVRTGKHKDSAFPAYMTVHKKQTTEEEIRRYKEDHDRTQKQEHHRGNHEKDHAHGHGHGHAQLSREAMLKRYKTMDSMWRPHVHRLLTVYDLSTYKSAVDLGAGSGVVGFELVKCYPGMQVTIFEVPPVINLIKEHFIHTDDQRKVTLISGDFFEIELPNADLYILGRMIHDWKFEQIRTLLGIVYDKLNPGGALMLFEKCLNDEKDGPVAAHLWDLAVMCACAGRLRSGQEYRDLLRQLRFVDVTITKTQPGCLFDAIYARKPTQ